MGLLRICRDPFDTLTVLVFRGIKVRPRTRYLVYEAQTDHGAQLSGSAANSNTEIVEAFQGKNPEGFTGFIAWFVPSKPFGGDPAILRSGTRWGADREVLGETPLAPEQNRRRSAREVRGRQKAKELDSKTPFLAIS